MPYNYTTSNYAVTSTPEGYGLSYPSMTPSYPNMTPSYPNMENTTDNPSYHIPWVFSEKKPHKCPVCNGTGKTCRPPHIPGDIHDWTSGGTEEYICNTCKGTGIVWNP
jgi:hypothetical protein